jgi:hypothetical protein
MIAFVTNVISVIDITPVSELGFVTMRKYFIGGN